MESTMSNIFAGKERRIQTYKVYNAATKRVYQTSQRIDLDQISLDLRKLTPNHLKWCSENWWSIW